MSAINHSHDPEVLKQIASASTAYVSNVLKEQLGGSEEFLAFERNFYYQIEELGSLRQSYEELRSSFCKLQEEKRAVELELVSEKAVREQDARNGAMELERSNVQQNAKLYSVKCEAESWKRKAETAAMEINCLKEHMKSVEREKNLAVQNLAELKPSLAEYDRHRQSLETYARRSKEIIVSSTKRMEELERAREALTLLVDHSEKQLNAISSKMQSWTQESSKAGARIMELENELIQTKAGQAQALARMERMEKTEKHTSELIKKLMEQNKDLQNGISALVKSVGNHVSEKDKELIEKSNQLHQEVSLCLKGSILDPKLSSPSMFG